MSNVQKIKARAKKFYYEHDKVVNAFSAGLAVAGVIGMRAVAHTKDDLTVTGCVEQIEDLTGDHRLLVRQKNGKTTPLYPTKKDPTLET